MFQFFGAEPGKLERYDTPTIDKWTQKNPDTGSPITEYIFSYDQLTKYIYIFFLKVHIKLLI